MKVLIIVDDSLFNTKTLVQQDLGFIFIGDFMDKTKYILISLLTTIVTIIVLITVILIPWAWSDANTHLTQLLHMNAYLINVLDKVVLFLVFPIQFYINVSVIINLWFKAYDLSPKQKQTQTKPKKKHKKINLAEYFFD